MTKGIKSIELWRFCNENIKTNGTVCHGYLEGKYFSVLLETQNEISIWIRWHKRPSLNQTPNVSGIRAEKLLNLILSRIEDNEECTTLVSQLKEIRKKNENYAIFAKTGVCTPLKVEEIREKRLKDEKNKAKKLTEEIKKTAKENETRRTLERAKKEEQRQLRLKQKQAEKEARLKAHHERMQKQRLLKFLKDQETTYTQMVFNAPDSTSPVIFQSDETAIILGHLNNNFYRIKVSDKNPSFFIIQNNEKIRKMSIAEIQQILLTIDEKLNQNGQYDAVLERAVSDYDKFRHLRFSENRNVQREKIAISKNPNNTLIS